MAVSRARKLLLLSVIHGGFAALFVACIGVIYYSVITARAENWGIAACGILLIEGLLIAVCGWDCPLESMHRRLGDDKGLFGLFLPQRWQRWVIPILAGLAGLGAVLLVVRAV
ncbi:MAG: hypothetical protein ACYTGV_14710 [Planctomycetota bacterium]